MSASGWYELSKSTKGHYRFVLKSANAETILTSAEYSSHSAAEKGIDAVRAAAHVHAHYECKTAVNGKPYFDLKAANHQVVGTSQMYSSDEARDEGIAAVKTHAAARTVKDHTAKTHT